MPPLLEALIDVATATTTTVVALTSGKRIFVYRVYLRSAGTQTVTFRDSTPTNMMGGLDFAARESLTLDLGRIQEGRPVPWFTCAIGTSFQMVTSAAVQVSGRILYGVEP